MANGEEMTTTPEQIEAVARAMCDTEWGEGYWDELMPYARREYKRQAASAINIMRPFIRDEVLEEAAKRVAELPMIVGIPGLPYERHRNSFEYAAAIRALKEKS
jgi:hypothetical protein